MIEQYIGDFPEVITTLFKKREAPQILMQLQSAVREAEKRALDQKRNERGAGSSAARVNFFAVRCFIGFEASYLLATKTHRGMLQIPAKESKKLIALVGEDAEKIIRSEAFKFVFAPYLHNQRLEMRFPSEKTVFSASARAQKITLLASFLTGRSLDEWAPKTQKSAAYFFRDYQPNICRFTGLDEYEEKKKLFTNAIQSKACSIREAESWDEYLEKIIKGKLSGMENDDNDCVNHTNRFTFLFRLICIHQMKNISNKP